MADVHIHDMFVAEPVRSPNTVDQLSPGERPARTAGQRLQEVRTPSDSQSAHLRLGLSAGLVMVGLVMDALPLLVVAELILLTAAFGRCPLYSVYNVSTAGGLHRTCDDDASCALPGTTRRERH